MANDAGTAFMDVRPDFKGFGREMSRGIDPHIEKSSKNVESKLGGAFTKVAGIAGGAFVGAQVVGFGKDMLALGTQVDTFGKKAGTVFEDSKGEVTKWAKTNASAFGVTDDTLVGLSASFGDLLKPMGFTAKQAANMSTDVVGLSGALSAWSGGTKSAAEVSQILASAMLGERDALKGLGISISEADVQGRLLAKGQEGLTGAALEQAKAVATQELIFEKSKDAQAAWADGSMDAVKKQNSLKEKIGELQEDLATKLQPAFAGAMTFVVDKFIPGLEGAFGTIGPIAQAAFGTVTDAIGKAAGFVKDHEAIFKGVALLVTTVLVPAFVLAAVEATISAGKQVAAWVMTHVQAVASAVVHTAQVGIMVAKWILMGATATAQAAAVAAAWLVSIGPIALVVAAVVALVVAVVKNWDTIKAATGAVWNWVKDHIGTIMRVVIGFVTGGLSEVVLAVIRNWDTITETTSRIWDGIKGIISAAWDGIKTVVQTGVRFIVDKFLGAVETILEGGARMFGWVPGVGEKLREARDKFAEFRDSVNRSLGGIEDKTIELFLKANDRNLGTAGDPIYANTGMLVPGHGDGDTVPGWLTPGEFINRKSIVQQQSVAAFEALNAGKADIVPRYATGGLVDFKYHLPGVDGIRSAAQSLFDDMAGTAAEVFREKAQAAADARAASGAIGGGLGVGGSWQGITAGLDAAGVPYTVTSAYRPGDPGFHGRGKAVDLVGDMARIFHTIAGFSGINELFYDPIGWFIDEGRRHSGAIGDHDDHVHAATFHTGGIVPGSPGQDRLALVEAGERISPVGEGMDDATIEKFAVAVAAAVAATPVKVISADIAQAQRSRRKAHS